MFTTSYFAPAYFAPAYFAPAYFAGAAASAATTPAFAAGRDWDVFRDIGSRLIAARIVEAIEFSDDPSLAGRSASKTLAIISPVGWSEDEGQGWDDEDGQTWTRKVAWSLTILTRHEHPEARDRRADRLMNMACNALNTKPLADLTLPGQTRLGNGKYVPAEPPGRGIRAIGEFSYFVTGTGSNHATEA